ncbi:MAG: HAMP domain-containing sensor histidine kinase [Reichenbachiella sp.]|uniref:sensor histidine kinase n=1 Tax=Reichenbachiella sp. TaxID=2184521 RepID=UPI002966F9C4|nr:HAMP domain-containing sensor histidine kinase [Reichenbachiella sp.]MDW3212200.1 HAMP domain-containing sensor histidine kinase [Reichenbachiella sp.]
MKLLAKATMYYLLVALIFFGIGGLLIYVNTEKLIREDIENFLINREEIATTQIVNGEPLSSLNNYEQKVSLIPETAKIDQLIFVDTLIYDIIDDKYQPYLQLTVNRRIGKQHYHIVISKSLIETRLLVTEIFLDMFYVFVGLLVALISLNLLVSRNLWRPFKDTLLRLQNYDLGRSEKINFRETSTVEFLQLNSILSRMTDRIRRDFLNLKEFTENASHEIQTPLAIIKSKTEMLMQSDNLNEHQFSFIKAIYDATVKLSKLNQGLLLLAKIENHQYVAEEDLDIHSIIDNNLKDYQEMMSLKKISIRVDLSGANIVQMNSNLAQILISNLLRNAIKHTPEGGKIEVIASDGSVRFLNSGEKIKTQNFQMFERFQKENSDSLGLGLAIVKKICESYSVPIRYSYEQDMHQFKLNFNTD